MSQRPFILVVIAAVLPGCSSFHVQEYVSPEINGRVLDAVTREPIAHVTVRRGHSESGDTSPLSERGAQRMLAQDQVHSNKEGLFHLSAQKDVLSFGGGGYGARLTLLHFDYETLRTNFPAKLIVRLSPKEPPRLDVGDVFLPPRPK